MKATRANAAYAVVWYFFDSVAYCRLLEELVWGGLGK